MTDLLGALAEPLAPTPFLYTMLRVLQLVVLAATLGVLLVRLPHWWCKRWRCIAPPLLSGAIAMALGYVTAESLVVGAPGGPRTFLFLVAGAGVLLQAVLAEDRPTCRARGPVSTRR